MLKLYFTTTVAEKRYIELITDAKAFDAYEEQTLNNNHNGNEVQASRSASRLLGLLESVTGENIIRISISSMATLLTCNSRVLQIITKDSTETAVFTRHSVRFAGTVSWTDKCCLGFIRGSQLDPFCSCSWRIARRCDRIDDHRKFWRDVGSTSSVI